MARRRGDPWREVDIVGEERDPGDGPTQDGAREHVEREMYADVDAAEVEQRQIGERHWPDPPPEDDQGRDLGGRFSRVPAGETRIAAPIRLVLRVEDARVGDGKRPRSPRPVPDDGIADVAQRGN